MILVLTAGGMGGEVMSEIAFTQVDASSKSMAQSGSKVTRKVT